MENKKKVKSISSAETKKEVKEDMSTKKESTNYSNYEADMAIIKAYENKSKNRLKVILAFILGIIATIALFSTLGLSNKNVNTTKTVKNTAKEPAYIGILMLNLEDSDAIDYYDLDTLETTLKKGVVVETVKTGSPASGYLKRGDIIIQMGREDIDNMDDLIDELAKYSAGDKVKFVVERNGRNRDLSIVLGSK